MCRPLHVLEEGERKERGKEEGRYKQREERGDRRTGEECMEGGRERWRMGERETGCRLGRRKGEGERGWRMEGRK